MRKSLKISTIVALWIGIWYLSVLIYSLINGIELSYNPIFPYPHDVIISLFNLLARADYYFATLTTLLRILVSIIISVILGTVIAIICARFDFLHSFIQPFLSAIRSVPVTVFVFILYLIIFSFTSMLITILMVFPIIFTCVYDGIKSIDKDLLEVCQIYKIPFKKRVKSLYLPTVMPFFVTGITSSIGLAWKAGVAAEALCPPDNSMGLNISLAKQNFDNEELFAWALTLVAINIVFELAFKKIIKVAFKRWLPNEVQNEDS